MSLLPSEVQQAMLSYLPVTMLPSCSLVSKAWQNASELTFYDHFLPVLGTPRNFLQSLENRSDILEDKDIRFFLAREIGKYPHLQKLLLELVLVSKDEEKGLAPANAITLLNAAIELRVTKMSFSGMDLRGVYISNAILDGAILDGTNLEGSNLEGVSFNEAWLRNANFRKCLLEGVSFAGVRRRSLSLARSESTPSFVYSSDGRYRANFYFGDFPKNVKIYELVSGECIFDFTHTTKIWYVKFSADSKLIAIGCADGKFKGKIQIWDIKCQKCLVVLPEYTGNGPIEFSNDRRLIAASCYNDKGVMVWNAQGDTWERAFWSRVAEVKIIKFSSDGRLIAVANSRFIRIFEVESRELLYKLSGSEGSCHSMALSYDWRFIAAGIGKKICLWQLDNGGEVRLLYTHAYDGNTYKSEIVFSDDGRFLLSNSGTFLQVWEVQSGQRRIWVKCEPSKNWFCNAALCPDGRFLAIGCKNKTVQVYDLRLRECIFILSGHPEIVRKVEFKNEGELVCYAPDVWRWQIDERAGTARLLSATKSKQNFEGLDLEGASGLSEHRLECLQLLGAQTVAPRESAKENLALCTIA